MMKKLLIASCLALTSCAAVVPAIPTVIDIVGDIAAKGDVVVVKGTQALLIAEYGYEAIGKTILPLLGTKIKGEQAAQVQRINREIFGALEKGKSASSDAARALEAAKAMRGIAQLEGIKKETS